MKNRSVISALLALTLFVLAGRTDGVAQTSDRAIIEEVQDFALTYVFASTTLRLCGGDIGWDFEHDDAQLANARRLEGLLVQRGMTEYQLDKTFETAAFQDRIQRELFDYYRSNGIRRFRRTDDILNATPDLVFNEATQTYDVRNNAEFCNLARKEMLAQSPVGRYFKPQ